MSEEVTEIKQQTGVEMVAAMVDKLVMEATTPELMVIAVAKPPSDAEVNRRITLLRKAHDQILPQLTAELSKIRPAIPAVFTRKGEKVQEPVYDEKAVKKIQKIQTFYTTLEEAITAAMTKREWAALSTILTQIEKENVIDKSGGKPTDGGAPANANT